MKRPEKKGIPEGLTRFDFEDRIEIRGYNQAWDEFEEFLPSEKEIATIIKDGGLPECSIPDCGACKNKRQKVAKAILKRLGGE